MAHIGWGELFSGLQLKDRGHVCEFLLPCQDFTSWLLPEPLTVGKIIPRNH